MRNTAGLYEYNSEEQKHIIYIDFCTIYNVQKLSALHLRRYYYKNLKQVIKHELVHAFVKEAFERKAKRYIAEKNRDASPIFLSILYFVGGYTNHDCIHNFKHTDLYNKVTNGYFKTFKELYSYLADYILDVMEQVIDIREINNIKDFTEKKTRNYISISNNFVFAPRRSGMSKQFENKSIQYLKMNGKLQKATLINRTWEIGCNTDITRIKELYYKKENSKAEYYRYTEDLAIPNCAEVKDMNKDIKNIKIKEYKNY